jgi:hypothetical protein
VTEEEIVLDGGLSFGLVINKIGISEDITGDKQKGV